MHSPLIRSRYPAQTVAYAIQADLKLPQHPLKTIPSLGLIKPLRLALIPNFSTIYPDDLTKIIDMHDLGDRVYAVLLPDFDCD
jgi:hypothetical protein